MKRRLVDIYFGFLSKERMTVLSLHVFRGLKQLQRSSMYVSYKVSTFASKELASANSCSARYCKDSHMITGFGNLLMYATVFIGHEMQRGTSGYILSLTVHMLMVTT